MSWTARNDAQNRAEAIVALTDGIANNENASDLQTYASQWGIPLAMQAQKTAAATPAPQPAQPVPADDEDDYEDEDYYDSDYYESSY
jgi:hypothetical protein